MSLFAFGIFGFVILEASAAPICAGGYDREDRSLVTKQYLPLEEMFSRMVELAVMSSNGTLSATQRMALDAEFQAWKGEIEHYGDLTRRGASDRTNLFLASVIDPTYLSLSTSVLTGANPLGQENSRASLDAVNDAISTLQVCLWGSWERHSIEGSPNDQSCAGGFSREDRKLVLREYLAARTILSKMAGMAETVANSVLSTSQRAMMDFDFEFTREQLDIFGSRVRRLASRKTNRFLTTVIDPIYLDLSTSTLNGETVAEMQANARDALDAVNNAVSTLTACMASTK